MEKASWAVRAQYMRALNELKHQINKELNLVQPGEGCNLDLTLAILEVEEFRYKYLGRASV